MSAWTRKAIHTLLLAAALAGGPAQADDPVQAGDYQLQGVMETASGLRLAADGTYKFFLMLGSVDEFDEGTWTAQDGKLLLKSSRPSAGPRVTFLRSEALPIAGARVTLEGPQAERGAFYSTVDFMSNGRRIPASIGGIASRSSGSVQPPIQAIAVSFMGVLRQYEETRIDVPQPGHNHFILRFEPGSLGIAPLDAARVRTSTVGDLVFVFPHIDKDLRYVRVRPK